MIIDKSKLAKLLTISDSIKSGNNKKEANSNSFNDITLPKLIITFTIFFFLLYLIINR